MLLLDEPLGALDARLRIDLQVELKRIQEQLGVTFIYVTHDQDEALTMSDRVAVLRDGRVEQCGAPQGLYEEPATAFVANFLGSSNLVEVEVEADDAGGCRLRLGAFTLQADQRAPEGAGGVATAMIRPENVVLCAQGTTGENVLPAMIEEVVFLGFHREVRVRIPSGALVKVDVPNEHEHAAQEPGAAVCVQLPARHLRVLRAADAAPEPAPRPPVAA